ncbi:hypothetical protein SRRS_06650 [Sporomusa rhizae]|uniref:DUF6155 family protein n=1 Tax=Sporomusa rhizae TaxID=357999 RepID=UPI00352BA9B7
MQQLKMTDLKKYLANKTQEELVKEIGDLCKRFPNVKEYYAANLVPDAEQDILEKYRKIIKNEFFPDRGMGKLRYSVINKAISDFKKLSKTPLNVAELMVSGVEYGIEFTNAYGDIDEKFYVKMAAMFEAAANYVNQEDLENTYQKRFWEMVDESSDIGWGFNEALMEIYYSYFNDEDEDE